MTALILDEQLYGLGVAGELNRAFKGLMKEKNVLCIDDSNTILRNIIDGSDAPFVYEKLGVRYEHFLLDEFQDTSSVQWDNFYPLLDESDSNDRDNLIVGDVKQSIYRFRQAMPEIFLGYKDSFKAWILSIARNKCNDYFREKAMQYEIPLEEVAEDDLADSRYGVSVISTVRETLNSLADKDKKILYLYFWKGLPQAEIAKQQNIPIGTVKSRLYTAKRNFKNQYPYCIDRPKGENVMKKLPEYMPEYKIEANAKEPFSVKWEELMGWFLVPKLGEKISWGMYDIPSRKCSQVFDMKVTSLLSLLILISILGTLSRISLSRQNILSKLSFSVLFFTERIR